MRPERLYLTLVKSLYLARLLHGGRVIFRWYGAMNNYFLLAAAALAGTLGGIANLVVACFGKSRTVISLNRGQAFH